MHPKFLLEQCRDPHTVNWMEDFTETPNILSFHGTGAFNITRFENWDSFLMEMVVRPRDRVIVSAKRRGAGHGGWSKNNPYLKASSNKIIGELQIDIHIRIHFHV